MRGCVTATATAHATVTYVSGLPLTAALPLLLTVYSALEHQPAQRTKSQHCVMLTMQRCVSMPAADNEPDTAAGAAQQRAQMWLLWL